jgi:hypothetical protein
LVRFLYTLRCASISQFAYYLLHLLRACTSLVDVTACRESDYVILLEPGAVTSTISPFKTPTTSPIATPSNIPTKAPIASLTTNPTKAPTKPPVAKSFQDLFPTLPAINQPAAAPAIASTPSNDDGSSFLDLFNELPAIAPVPSSKVVDASMNEVNVVDNSLYSPGYVVDDAGKDLLIQLGRTVGLCSTCINTGTLRSGFRAEVRGTISEVSENNGPHKLAVSFVQLSNNLTSICQQPSISATVTGSSSTSPTQSPLFLRSNNNGIGFYSRFQNFVDSLFDNLI